MQIPDLPQYIKLSQKVRNQCFCVPLNTFGQQVPNCGAPGVTDAGGLFELQLLNVQMGMAGIPGGCGLFFYTYVIAYSVTFGPSGAYQIQAFDKFLGVWEMVMFSGVLDQTTGALNAYQPFLTVDQIPVFWNNVVLPPTSPNSGFLMNPV